MPGTHWKVQGASLRKRAGRSLTWRMLGTRTWRSAPDPLGGLMPPIRANHPSPPLPSPPRLNAKPSVR